MKILISIFIISSIFTQGCSKQNENDVLGAEAVDYITGQPLAQAEVIGITYNSCGPWVIGYCGSKDTLLGYTSQTGRFEDWKLIYGYGSSDLEIRKDNYYPAGRYRDCLYEHKNYGNTNLEKFHLFRIAAFEITATATQIYSYPDPYLHVLPVLKNGLLPQLSDDGQIRPLNLSTQSQPSFFAVGAGDLTNRIFIIKRYDSPYRLDTLYKADIYLPAGSIKPISIVY